MKKSATLAFSGFDVDIEFDDTQSPSTVRAVIDALPIEMTIEVWGDEIYSSAIPVKAGEENAKSKVEVYDVAYWPKGSALCFFFGPTPISKAGEILPYSPVNVIGTVKSRPSDVQKFLKSVKELHVDREVPVILR
jgi:hypothetical protein